MTKTTKSPDSFDTRDPDLWRCPWQFYDSLLETREPFFVEPLSAWVITDYDQVVEAVLDNETFSQKSLQKLGAAALGPKRPAVQAAEAKGLPHVPVMVYNDPPEHTRHRALVDQAFKPKRIKAMEPEIRQMAHDLLDAIKPGEIDLVSQYASPLPLLVIAKALGIDNADLDQFKIWSDAIFARLGSQLTEEEEVKAALLYVDMQHYLAALIQKRRKEPGDDLLSQMIAAKVEGERSLGDNELVFICRTLISAGNETTTSLVSAAAMRLAHDEEMQRRVREDRGLIPALLEEQLRIEGPSQIGLPRVATRDVVVGTTTIPGGSIVLLGWGAADRDPEKYECPAEFRLDRPAGRTHIAFGLGRHFCVGASLARSEGRIAIETLLDRFTWLAPSASDEVEYRSTWLSHYLERAPMRVTLDERSQG